MYLRELFIKNSGPIRDLHLELTFDENDRPIPHVIVGRNGCGKTNLLSIIAEALMQGANSAYTDILTQQNLARSYFRILGQKTLTHGEAAGFSVLRFDEGGSDLFYHEKTGDITTEQAKELLPETLSPGVSWTEQRSKAFQMDEEKARSIYEPGVYVYFPASRSEHPFWFNQESIISDTFDVSDRFAQRLGKPIFVERGIDAFAQWLLGVMTESRLKAVSAEFVPGNTDRVNVELDTAGYIPTQRPLIWADTLLQIIMDKPDANFYWAGRRNPRKVGVSSGNQLLATGLDSLSGGQATLLAVFGTILRYGDAAGLGPANMQGVVVIDELDAHMHIDLQMNALPKLIAMFPQIQFIVSSHSPFFALGIETNFPNNGVRIIDLPTGLAVSAEAYNEFGSALNALMETHAFEEKIGQFLAAAEQPIVWVGGETDVPYFQTAAKLLGYPGLAAYFQWIGTPSRSGGGEYTGDDSLKAAVKFLRANPGFTHRKVIVLYDNDANQADEDFDCVHIIGLPKIEAAAVEDGIENMLPAHVFTEDVFEDKEKRSGIVGKPKIIPELRKTRLCERLCGEDADPANFQNFAPILDRINRIVTADAGGQDS